MNNMMASKNGYRDVLNFSDDSEMRTDCFGLIARGKRFFLSHYINVDEGKQVLHELTAMELAQIQKDWKADGWTERFIETWITGTVT